MPEEFLGRLREGLRTRLYPNTPLFIKQLARGVGRSENTISRWRSGESRVLAEDLYRIAHFLAQRGDKKFLLEIFADLLPATRANVDLEDTVLSLVRHAIAQIEDSDPVNRDSLVWCTADGMLFAAPLGHAELVARTLRLPKNEPSDLIAYAARVLGWVAVTLRSDNTAIIHHDGRKVAPLAVERASEWLAQREGRINLVRRSIHVDGDWVHARHASVEAAIAAITSVGAFGRFPRQPWTVKRLSLDQVADRRLAALLRAHTAAPDTLIHAAAEMGAFTTSNLFAIEGEEVISQYAATEFRYNTQAIVGQNILSRPDTDYALMVKTRVLQTKREGAQYCEIEGIINNMHMHYLNLALAEPGATGRVLTSTVPVELRILSAA